MINIKSGIRYTMKAVVRFAMACLVLLFASRNIGYEIKEGIVTFNGKEIKGKNFVVLNENFAKEDTTAYYKKYRLPGADITTFVALDNRYAKDKMWFTITMKKEKVKTITLLNTM